MCFDIFLMTTWILFFDDNIKHIPSLRESLKTGLINLIIFYQFNFQKISIYSKFSKIKRFDIQNSILKFNILWLIFIIQN